MSSTVTVWVLHLSKPETFVCGPYLTLDEAIAAGRGRVEDPNLKDGYVRVQAGLLVRLDDIRTTSLREMYQDRVRVAMDGTPYTDEELDRRFPDHQYIRERLPLGRKLTAL